MGRKPASAMTHSTRVVLHCQYAWSSVCLWMALFTYVPTEMISSCKYQVLLSDQPKCKSSWQLKSNRIKFKMVTLKKFVLEETK